MIFSKRYVIEDIELNNNLENPFNWTGADNSITLKFCTILGVFKLIYKGRTFISSRESNANALKEIIFLCSFGNKYVKAIK